MNNLDKLKKILKDGKYFVGANVTVKKLKQSLIKQIFLSSNCPENIRTRVEGYEGVEIIQMSENSYDLAMICKKQFNVNVISN